ncbi:MAG: wax ester/triacylglycerol synthase family O-acyltransferase [Gordonia sp. (in: high G+C Gram-positive bacteria)]|uniref:wax ester/triacylglycerol synthase domain-containing protein n=1 Tax=Gordonia sp. (in: high G+C Gram-positive bacteria) TaxID=84139 RepID=UPI0039E5D3DF
MASTRAAVRRLHPVDARMLWAAPRAHSDQFLLFAFAATGVDAAAVERQVLAAARGIERFGVVAREVPGHLDYPSWAPRPPTSEQVLTHTVDAGTWAGMLRHLGGLIADQLDAHEAAWRVHLFPGIADPRDGSPLRVAVLQISHALADGRGSSALARRLFAADPPAHAATREPAPRASVAAARGVARLPVQVAGMVGGGLRAYRLSRAEAAVPGPVPPCRANRPPGVRRELRTVTVDKSAVGPPVTPWAIGAIGRAMSAAGLVDAAPVVELTVARDPEPGLANNFFMAGIVAGDADAVHTQVAAARRRDADAARVAARRAEACTPAALMHWATTGFPATDPPGAVTGHTVVSSVNRGAADLVLAGGAVRLTAGFPALSTAHSLTHGVHGIGDAITLSVLADPDIIDVDGYVAALTAAL